MVKEIAATAIPPIYGRVREILEAARSKQDWTVAAKAAPSLKKSASKKKGAAE